MKLAEEYAFDGLQHLPPMTNGEMDAHMKHLTSVMRRTQRDALEWVLKSEEDAANKVQSCISVSGGEIYPLTYRQIHFDLIKLLQDKLKEIGRP